MRRLREHAGLTQEQLAERAGLSTNAVSALERGERRHPYPKTVRALSAALTLRPDEAARLAASVPRRPGPRRVRPPGPARPGAGGGATGAPAAPPAVPPDRPPAPRQLPAANCDFTGRRAELTALDALLPAVSTGAPGTSSTLARPDGAGHPVADAGRAGAVTVMINGTAGVGKTTLALTWAHRVRHLFGDGQLYVNLRGYDPGPEIRPDQALDGFLRALHVPTASIPPTVEAKAALFRSVLDGRQVLILLDNANSPAQVRPLLPGSSSCLVMVTSRDELTGLAVSVGATRINVDLLPPTDAVAMLTGIVGARRAEVEPGAVGRLASLCAYLPLALQLTGRRAAARPGARLGDLVTELADDADRLDILSDTRDETTAVRHVFSFSYRNLDEQHAWLFRLLGLHHGPDISRHAAAALAGCTPARAQRLLGGLAEANVAHHVGCDRFGLHDLLRAYARELVEATVDDVDRFEAVRRLVGFYLHMASAANRLLHPGRRNVSVAGAPPPQHTVALFSYQDALNWCELERANLVAAIRLAAANHLQTAAWELADHLWSYFYIGKYWDDWSTACAVGLDAARQIDDRKGQQWMLNGLATVHRDLHRYQQAIGCFRQTLQIARESGDKVSEASSLSNLGDVHLGLRRFDQALTYSRESLRIIQETDDPYLEGIALGNVGEAYLGLHRYHEALEQFVEVLDLCRKIDHRHGEAMTLIHLGAVHLGLSRHDTAVSHLMQALDLCRDLGDRHGEALALRHLGRVHHAVGRERVAAGYWRAALAVLERLGDPTADEVRADLCVLAPGP